MGRAKTMKTKLKMKCPNCSYWNTILVEKVFSEQTSSEPKVKAFIPLYLPSKTEKCPKRGHFFAKEKELIRLVPSTT
jgi:phage FluMu protein Com